MKYFLVAGEASGDLHSSHLMKGILASDAEAKFQFMGGDLMSEVSGSQPLRHFREMNYMGIFNVLAHLPSILGTMRKGRRVAKEFHPDVVILTDYSGFNLRFAKHMKREGFSVFYYIAPKVWAWNEKRIKKIRKWVDRLFVIFPFELAYFKKHGVEVEYFGNPLSDALEVYLERIGGAAEGSEKHGEGLLRELEIAQVDGEVDERPVIALLAGSRRQEIQLLLPEMIRTSRSFPEYRFVVAGAPSVDAKLYKELLEGSGIALVFGQTYELLMGSKAAIVTSGTATLETALLDVPQVVVYKTGELLYRVGRLFVSFDFFSLVNLMLGREVVKEVLQYDVAEQAAKELKRILEKEEVERKMKDDYAEIRELCGKSGASQRAAKRMVELVLEK